MNLSANFLDISNIKKISIFPPQQDRLAWNSLPDFIQKCIQNNGENALKRELPTIYATDYLRFSRDGNRVDFEQKYFAKREILIDCVLYYCHLDTSEDNLFDRIINVIISICEESGWQLPAHNGYIRDSELYPFADTTHPVIDLFAAETGSLLSICKYLLEDHLKAKAPFVLKRIDEEIQQRIIQPFLHDHFWWMGSGFELEDETMCNWTPWCCQNILLTTQLSSSQITADDQKNVLNKVCYALDCFYKDYQTDGACNEGVAYYRHAGLCFYNCIELLDHVSDGGFKHWFNETKVKNMAEFLVANHVEGHRYFNFADSSALLEPCDVREYLFAKAVSSIPAKHHALTDWKQSLDSGQKHRLANEYSLYYQLQGAFFANEMLEQLSEELNIHSSIDRYYPSIGQLISRDDNFILSVKAGHNDDSHNHNDVGQVIVYQKHNQTFLPVLIDIGVGTYTKQTFSKERYQIWTMQSHWHNLPSFSDNMQKEGREFCATNVVTDIQEDTTNISMDIAQAYSDQAGVKSYYREVSLIKNNRLTITDKFILKDGVTHHDVWLNLIFSQRPEVIENKIVFESGFIRFAHDVDIRIETKAIDDPRLRIAWPEQIYRLRIQDKKMVNKLEGSISFDICCHETN